MEAEALRFPPSKSLKGLTGVPCKQGQGHYLGVNCSRRGSKGAVWTTPQGGFAVAPRNLEGSFPAGGSGQSPRVLGGPLCHSPQRHLGAHSGLSALHMAAALEGGR